MKHQIVKRDFSLIIVVDSRYNPDVFKLIKAGKVADLIDYCYQHYINDDIDNMYHDYYEKPELSINPETMPEIQKTSKKICSAPFGSLMGD